MSRVGEISVVRRTSTESPPVPAPAGYQAEMSDGNGSFRVRSAWPISVNSAGSYGPVDALHSDHVIINHINEPEPAHAQPVVLALVKTRRRVGI